MTKKLLTQVRFHTSFFIKFVFRQSHFGPVILWVPYFFDPTNFQNKNNKTSIGFYTIEINQINENLIELFILEKCIKYHKNVY